MSSARVARSRPFIVLWVLAVVAGTAAFSVHVGMRTRSLELGYELGRAHARVARLREVRRVLELEAESYKTPERVDLVARTLLGMSEPPPERILSAGPEPADDEAPEGASPTVPAAGESP